MVNHVAFLTNIPAPYRIPLFNYLGTLKDLHVDFYFSALTNSFRKWKVPSTANFSFDCKFLPGFELPIKKDGEFRSLHMNPTMLSNLLKHQYNAIVAGGMYPNTYQAILYSKLKKVPFIFWSEDTIDSHKNDNLLTCRVRKIIYNHSTMIIAATTAAKEYAMIMGVDEDRIHISYNTVDVSDFRQKVKDCVPMINQIKNELSLTGQIVLFVGQLVKRKGVNLLLDAFTLLKKQIPDAGLLIVGDGPERETMQDRCVKEKILDVKFMGNLSQEETAECFAVADVFALMSLIDLSPLVLNEAITASLPIVCSKFAGNARDFIIEEKNGCVVNPEDSVDVANKLTCILQDKSLLKEMRSQSSLVSDMLTVENAGKQFAQTIRLVISKEAKIES